MYVFTDDEKAKIKKAMQIVTEELRRIYDESRKREIRIWCPFMHGLHNGDSWHLIIGQTKMILFNQYDSEYRSDLGPFNLEKLFSSINKNMDRNYNVAVSFMRCYEKIKEKLLEEITVECDDRKTIDNLLNQIIEDHTATVDVQLPETNSHQKLEVYEEDGKKVGVFDFGSQIVKIITKGSIILVDEKEEKQPLRKNK